ncbi:uncharacterized protein [Prorops nasuta]|uniref:uncharacterized protein n=1 Tax=Prorops nasuta TaxID=863751 RepID=UPI0034CE05B5
MRACLSPPSGQCKSTSYHLYFSKKIWQIMPFFPISTKLVKTNFAPYVSEESHRDGFPRVTRSGCHVEDKGTIKRPRMAAGLLRISPQSRDIQTASSPSTTSCHPLSLASPKRHFCVLWALRWKKKRFKKAHYEAAPPPPTLSITLSSSSVATLLQLRESK